MGEHLKIDIFPFKKRDYDFIGSNHIGGIIDGTRNA